MTIYTGRVSLKSCVALANALTSNPARRRPMCAMPSPVSVERWSRLAKSSQFGVATGRLKTNSTMSAMFLLVKITAKFELGNAPQALAALRNAILALLRFEGWPSTPTAFRHFDAHPQLALHLLGAFHPAFTEHSITLIS